MVKKSMYRDIKRLQMQGKSQRETSRQTGLSPKTVRKYWKMEDGAYQAMLDELRERTKVFDTLKEAVQEIYKNNEYIKLPMASVYDYLEEKHKDLPGNEQSLRNFVRYLVESRQLVLNANKREYMKVAELPYGKQLQIDYGSIANPSGGKYFIFGAVLSASRFKYAALEERPFTAEMLLVHLLDCFDFIGGIPLEIVIDQDCTMVVEENSGDIVFTKLFSDFIKEMGFTVRVCRKADPESKGKIENMVKFVKYSFFPTRKFESLAEARISLLSWLSRRANGKLSQATGKIPAIEIVEERKHLQPIRNSIHRKDSRAAREVRQADPKCRISVDASQYELPDNYRNRRVEIYRTADTLFVYDPVTNAEVCRYALSLLPGRLVTNRPAVREKGVRTRELESEVMAYFDLPRWKTFLEVNAKAFSRYVRDQCRDARRYFGDGKTAPNLIDEALEYCLANGTLSMTNLSDTLDYLAQQKLPEKVVPVNLTGAINRSRLNAPVVARPDLAPYKRLLARVGGEK